MTREEFDRDTARLAELSHLIPALLPEILKAGGSKEQARVDAKVWAERLDPLFREHHEIAARLKAAISAA